MENQPNPSDTHEQIERRRIVEQFLVFQESLPKVNSLSYQWLLNEMVPLCMSVENNLNRLDDNSSSSSQSSETIEEELANSLNKVNIDEFNSIPSHRLIRQLLDADSKQKDRVFERLYKIGYGIGSKMTELLIFSNNPNLSFNSMDALGMIRFICKEVWKLVYGKQIDNLKTNHRGIFYLFDYTFPPIQNLSVNGDMGSLLKLVEPYLQVPLGVIAGILTSLGMSEEDLSVSYTYVDIPQEKKRPTGQFPKGINFSVQISPLSKGNN